MKTALTIVLCLTGMAIPAELTQADTITVCQDGGCDHAGIQSAIDASSDGDTIWISAGVYTPGAQLDTVGKAITLRGEFDKNGALATIIDGEGSHRVAICQSGEGPETILERLVFRNGLATDGGGLMINDSSPTVIRCTFRDNTAELSGGGVWIQDGSPSLVDCDFLNNRSEGSYGGGGLFSDDSSPALEGCLFEGNQAIDSLGDGGGAHFFGGGTTTLTNCTFTDNEAGDSGGGVFADPYSFSSTLVLECTDVSFLNNASSDREIGRAHV